MNLKGSLNLLILHTLSCGALHGYEILRRIRQQSGEVLDFTEGTLYPTLHSLEEQGLIEASVTVENGRRRRCYALTPAGESALQEERAAWERYARAINDVLNSRPQD